MPELYRLADGFHVNTQAEARHSGQPWEKANVPVSRKEILAYLNDLVGSVYGRVNSTPMPEHPLDDEAQGEELPERAAPPAEVPARVESASPPADLKTDAVEAAILESEGTAFVRFLSATLDRLGELRGRGWNGLRALAKRHDSRDSLERGIGFFILEAPDLIREDKPE